MRCAVAALVVLLMDATVADAQVQQAAIEGRVIDSSGLPIAGAAISLRDEGTNRTRSTATDPSGSYRLTDLPPSEYVFDASFPGFAPYEQRLTLAVGQVSRLDATLAPASITASTVVSAAPTVLRSAETALTARIDTERIEELPVRSRNYLEFALLTPGVVPSRPTSRANGAPAAQDSGFSFAGLRPRSNMLTIDGLDNNDEFSGGSRTELSLEIVREFQVVTGGWSAENGGGSGGAINVVTKSGANVLHGDAFLFGQNGRLNARPTIPEQAASRPPLSRVRGGLAIGGPIARDRTFYYAAAEQEEAREGAETELSGKVTHHVTDRHSVNIRVASTRRRDDAEFDTGGFAGVSARGSSRVSDAAVTGTWTAIIGSRTINDVRAQLATRRVEHTPRDPQGPAIVIPGVFASGRPYVGSSTHDQRYLDAGDTLAFATGPHLMKTGIDIRRVDVSGHVMDGSGGLYTFASVGSFAAHAPEQFRQVFADPVVDEATTRVGLFAQEHWTPRPAVTVDAGLRFGSQALPSVLHIASRQFSPRIGVAWMPATGWLLRAGAGQFADRIVLAAVEPALRLDGTRGFEQIVDGAAALSSVAPSIYTVRPGHWNPSSRQMNVAIERALTTVTSASVSYTVARGRALPRTVNVNLPPPAIGLDGPRFGATRINPAYTDIFELQPTASSTYHGITASVNRRLANELEWSASYTLSRATDTASDFDEQPQNPHALAAEQARSRYDQPHRFVASALFDLPVGEEEDRTPGVTPPLWVRALSNIEVAPIVTVASGTPQNPIRGIDESRSHAFPPVDRPPAWGRNSLRLPAYASLDVRVLKFVPVKPHGKLDIVVEVFNALNRTNVLSLNTVYGPGSRPAPTFGQPIEVDIARQLQLSIDFEF